MTLKSICSERSLVLPCWCLLARDCWAVSFGPLEAVWLRLGHCVVTVPPDSLHDFCSEALSLSKAS